MSPRGQGIVGGGWESASGRRVPKGGARSPRGGARGLYPPSRVSLCLLVLVSFLPLSFDINIFKWWWWWWYKLNLSSVYSNSNVSSEAYRLCNCILRIQNIEFLKVSPSYSQLASLFRSIGIIHRNYSDIWPYLIRKDSPLLSARLRLHRSSAYTAIFIWFLRKFLDCCVQQTLFNVMLGLVVMDDISLVCGLGRREGTNYAEWK